MLLNFKKTRTSLKRETVLTLCERCAVIMFVSDAKPERHYQLLRKFSDLMAANSLDGSEECPICMEKLEVNKAIRYV